MEEVFASVEELRPRHKLKKKAEGVEITTLLTVIRGVQIHCGSKGTNSTAASKNPEKPMTSVECC